MDLKRVFRLSAQSKIAFVGAGGKTTAMFKLARSYRGLVLVTTTTHLAESQLSLADQWIRVEKVEDLPGEREEIVGQMVLFVGPRVGDGRVGGLSAGVLDGLKGLADQWNCPLLIEADGARRLPLKAPADHEPAVPEFVDGVVVVAGLSGLDKRLNEKWVHRPERFADLASISLGERITREGLLRVLVSPGGGLKGIPAQAWKMLLFNQIDAYPNWRSLLSYLPEILAQFHAVGFSVIEDGLILEVREKIAGVVLAAGGSSRLGKPKQLLDWKGKPFILRAAEIALQADLNPVIVVTGSAGNDAAKVLDHLDVEVIHNPDWSRGQSTSIQEGIRHLPPHLGGAVFLLVDQPQIPPDLVKKLVQAHARQLPPIVSARVNSRRANPVLFDHTLFPDLIDLQGDVGGRVLFNENRVFFVTWEDEAIGLDVDTLEEYQKLRELYSD